MGPGCETDIGSGKKQYVHNNNSFIGFPAIFLIITGIATFVFDLLV